MAYSSITLHTWHVSLLILLSASQKGWWHQGVGPSHQNQRKWNLYCSWVGIQHLPPLHISHLRHVGPSRWRPRSKSSNTQLHQGTQLGLVDKCSINEYPSTRGCENRRSTNLILTSFIYTSRLAPNNRINEYWHRAQNMQNPLTLVVWETERPSALASGADLTKRSNDVVSACDAPPFAEMVMGNPL